MQNNQILSSSIIFYSNQFNFHKLSLNINSSIKLILFSNFTKYRNNYKDEKEDAIELIERYGDPYKFIIHDLKGELALDLGVTGAPETFLVSNGTLIAHYRGEVNDMIWKDVFMPIIYREGLFKND